MAGTTDLIPADDPRVERYASDPPVEGGRCVLLWVQRAKRAVANPAANLAIDVADRLRLPIVAAFCLVPSYPQATLRSFVFMAEGLRELPDAFAARGIGWVLRVGEPIETIPRLAAEIDAAVIVTDQDPLRLGREWRAAVASRSAAPLVAIDTDTIAPPAAFPKEEYSAYRFRPKLWRVIEEQGLLAPVTDRSAAVRDDLSLLRDGPDPIAVLATLPLDRSVGPSPTVAGGRAEALRRLERFVAERLAVYHTERDRPDREGQSGLGPYLHFGQIGPLEVARAVRNAPPAGLSRGSDPSAESTREGDGAAPDAGAGAFLDELVTQRELAVNFALRNPAYDRYEAIPDWGRKTLAKHASDPRPALYDRAQLETGRTADRLWNAAQLQMVMDGTMPNRLRMYWAKQILLWTRSPEEAYAITMAMNDRYFLCGRDAAGYANVAWAIGGRHDRPFPPERPVFGLVRPMGLKGMEKKFDTLAYIAAVEERVGRPIGPIPPGSAGRGRRSSGSPRGVAS